MMKGLFLINNFGLFQGDSSSYYLHDGLDIVLANETKIFAITDGVVRVVNDAVQNYRTIIIEDANDPYHAWSYTHVGDIRVNVGDAVRQGDWLAVIEFAGIEHIHLTRLERFSRLTDWTDDTVIARQPDGYFTYSDTQAPIFGDAFEFYRNGSDQPLNANALAGAVDIAVLLRDPGEDNHNKVGGLMGMPVGFGDRLAVSRIVYRIQGEEYDSGWKKSFDFSELTINAWDGTLPATIYKPSNWGGDKCLSSYLITNISEEGLPDSSSAWDTTKLADGEYRITVWAYDFMGNRAEKTETVRVQNH